MNHFIFYLKKQSVFLVALCLLFVGFSCSKDEPLEDPSYALDVYVKKESDATYLIVEDYEKIGDDVPSIHDLRSHIYCRKLLPEPYLEKVSEKIKNGEKFKTLEKVKPLSSIPGMNKEGAKFRIFRIAINGDQCLQRDLTLIDIRPR